VTDHLVVTLLQAAQEVTGNRLVIIIIVSSFSLNASVPLDEILEGIGRVFYSNCDKTGHNELIKSLAADLKTFLQNPT